MILSPYDSENFPEIREGVRKLCADFPGDYWRKLDEKREYPTAFVQALTEAGYLSVLIPEEYGGSGLGLSITHSIVTGLLGGEIKLTSTVGAGTRFCITIPLTAKSR